MARPIDSSEQMTPSVSFFLDLQTWTQTWPAPLTRILKVGDLPEGTVAPLLGETGVMPLAARAGPAVARMTPVASTPARERRVIGQH